MIVRNSRIYFERSFSNSAQVQHLFIGQCIRSRKRSLFELNGLSWARTKGTRSSRER